MKFSLLLLLLLFAYNFSAAAMQRLFSQDLEQRTRRYEKAFSKKKEIKNKSKMQQEINYKDRYKESVLSYALCSNKNNEFIKWLIHNGAQIEETADHQPLFHEAIKRIDPELMELFINKGALERYNVMSCKSELFNVLGSALHAALIWAKDSQEKENVQKKFHCCANLLLNAGCPVNPIHCLRNFPIDNALRLDIPCMVDWCLRAGADLLIKHKVPALVCWWHYLNLSTVEFAKKLILHSHKEDHGPLISGSIRKKSIAPLVVIQWQKKLEELKQLQKLREEPKLLFSWLPKDLGSQLDGYMKENLGLLPKRID